MKKSAKLLSLLLAAVMTAGNVVPAFAAPASGDYHVELEEVGQFTKDGLQVSYDSFVEVTGENAATVYDMKGGKVFSESVKSSEYLEKDMYEYAKSDSSDVNSSALVSADGKVLIPFEYAFYAWPGGSRDTNRRFILAYYGTEETEKTDEALFYTTDDMIAIGSPGKDDTLYKGYAKIFDIQNEKFVDSMQFEMVDKYETIKIVGNSILVKNEDGSHTLYDADGKKLTDLKGYIETTNSVIIEDSTGGSGSRVYDESGKEIFSSDVRIDTFNSTNNYLYQYKDGKYTVIDSTGKQLFDTQFTSIPTEEYNVFKVTDGDVTTFYDISGKEIGSTEGDSWSLGFGRFALQTGVKTFTLIGPSGKIADEIKEEQVGSTYSKDGSIVSYNDGTPYLTIDENYNYRKYDQGILVATTYGDGEPGIYDIFTGKKLVDDGFKDVYRLGDRIVLEYRDGADYVYKTYKINVVEGK